MADPGWRPTPNGAPKAATAANGAKARQGNVEIGTAWKWGQARMAGLARMAGPGTTRIGDGRPELETGPKIRPLRGR